MERTGRCFRNYLMGLLLLGGLLLETACSVREDRMPCPCQLCLDFVGPEIDEGALAGLMVTSMKGFVWKDTVDIAKVRNGYRVSVPQTFLHIRSWIGADSCASESGIVIPYGRDCPRVYMHDSDIKAEGEYITETVTLRKNHCVLTLSIEGEGRLSSDLRLKGNVAGYDAEGQPLYGNFSCLLDEGGLESGYRAVLPRQTDASLMLEVDDGKGDCKAFALGQYIVSSGYDWTSPDLDDVSVTLDYAMTEIRLVVGGWESVYRYDIEI